MAIKLNTSEAVDLSNVDARSVRPEGTYQWAVVGQDLKEAKSTQAMGELTLKQLSVLDDPTSAVGSPITFRVMFPDIGDEDAFKAKLVADGKATAATADEVMAERKAQAARGVRDVGIALCGYEDLPAVPRWSKEDKCFLYADGTTATKAEKDVAIKVRNDAAYDFAVKAFSGETDLTRYTVYGNLKHREFNGNTQEEIGYIKPLPPKDGKILGIK